MSRMAPRTAAPSPPAGAADAPVSRRCVLALAAALCLTAVAPGPARAASLAETFGASDPMSTATVDHSAWGDLLAAYVHEAGDGVNRVDYAGLADNAADLEKLGAYIDTLQDTQVSQLARDEQFAFWTNLYNALTVEVVVEHYPVASIRDISISPGLFSVGPWGRKLATVEGQDLSLDDIEHEILRKAWDEPRVHYAVNCASIGCPNLARTPFTGAGLDAQLDFAARAYVNHPRGASFEEGTLVLSKIFDWYGEDFGASRQARLDAISAHAEPALAQKLRAHEGRIRYAYDWSLNDAGRE